MVQGNTPHPKTVAVAGRNSGSKQYNDSMNVEIIRNPIPKSQLTTLAEGKYLELVKAVVDVERQIMAIGGVMHADEEAVLLDDGSQQEDLWGINLYPLPGVEQWVEYDSLINLRPGLGNRSRGVDDSQTRSRIEAIVTLLVREDEG